MTDWNQLDRDALPDVVAAVEAVASARGVAPRYIWHSLHQSLSSTDEYAYKPADEITGAVVELVRRVYSKWPEAQQLSAKALSYVSSKYSEPYGSLVVVAPVRTDGNGGHLIDVASEVHRYRLRYELHGVYVRLESCLVDHL